MPLIRDITALVTHKHGFASEFYHLQLFQRVGDETEHKYAVVKDITMKTIDAGQMLPEDLEPINLSRDGVQRLMDSLWQAGLRPSFRSEINNAGEISALKEHLVDMRRIAFSQLAILETPPLREINFRGAQTGRTEA